MTGVTIGAVITGATATRSLTPHVAERPEGLVVRALGVLRPINLSRGSGLYGGPPEAGETGEIMIRTPYATLRGAARIGACAAALLMAVATSGSALADAASEGKAVLERNCGRCHGVAAGAQSPLSKAPNLGTVLRSYPAVP